MFRSLPATEARALRLTMNMTVRVEYVYRLPFPSGFIRALSTPTARASLNRDWVLAI